MRRRRRRASATTPASDIYYRSIQQRPEDFLTVRDYLWRWDTDWFWCSRAFGVQNPPIRRLWPQRYRRSDVYWSSSRSSGATASKRGSTGPRGKPAARGRHPGRRGPGRAARPSSSTSSTAQIGMEPVWLCPLRQRDPDAAWDALPARPGDVVRQRRLLGRRRPAARASPRRPQPARSSELVADLGGHKSLYSTAFYPEDEFWAAYSGPAYECSRRATTRTAGCSTCTPSPSSDASDPVRGQMSRMTLADVDRAGAAGCARSASTPTTAAAPGPQDAEVAARCCAPRARCPTWLTAPGSSAWPAPTSPASWRSRATSTPRSATMLERPHRQPVRGRSGSTCCATLGPKALRWVDAAAGGVRRPPAGSGLRHSQGARRRRDQPPLRRVQHVLRVGARAVDGLHLRRASRPRTRRWRRRRSTSSTWSRASSACSRACGCSTSAAAGAAWCVHAAQALRRAGARRHPVARSRPSGRRRRSPSEGLADLAEVRFQRLPRRDRRAASTRSARSGSPSTSARHNLPSYFSFLPAS